MESFTSTTRYDTKIETFEPCIIDVSSQQQSVQHQQQHQQIIKSNIVSRSSTQSSQDNHNEIINVDDNETNLQNEQVGHIHINNGQQNLTLTPVRLPAVLDGEFFSVIRVDDTNVTVKCHQCQKLLNGNLKSTGNFLSHLKRLHPMVMDKIKTKSNLRKPAIAYVDMSAEKCPEVVRTKRGYRKCYKADEQQQQQQHQQNLEDSYESIDQAECETPVMKRRKSVESNEYNHDANNIVRINQNNNSYNGEDEFDAIGKNVAVKLRNMRIDQRIFAEKLLNDVLFEGQLGTLNRDFSVQNVR
ncbi:hypothetical protein HCN44_002114 [Aphidius gifuensis]|uniref:Protein stand still-like n=1 Tax=Aphidius gifuensis TaxID=684658 RepID=A0A835CUI7_APHGI|nr:uncharacterized protein LOC122847468 [Aphidius gifuensis]KAF7996482.1 hypothetical protein HCN44_002114 [Aphidius gifuensis]